MSIINNIFGKKEEPIKTYSDFWNWFQKHEKAFFNAVKSNKNIEKDFFDQMAPKLNELKEGFYFLTGMYDKDTVELILTADGNPKNIVFIEELMEQAPNLKGWKFTTLKQATDIENVGINMGGYSFDSDHLFFYSNDHPEYPDVIDITVVHIEQNDENQALIGNGTYIFLDNYLGELDFVNNIDHLRIIGKKDAEKELVPISKLKDFLTWRQKECIEKYDEIRYDSSDDEYGIFEAQLENGNMLVAVLNTQLLNWEHKASHPWIAVITIKFDGSKNNGMPNQKDYERLNEMEDAILQQLTDNEGYLNIGRQTANGERDVYFACTDFRKPSKVFFNTQQSNENTFEIDYDIYKDKYWQSFDHFRTFN